MEILENYRTTHEEDNCPRRPISCTNCGDTIPFEELEDHAEHECSVICGMLDTGP